MPLDPELEPGERLLLLRTYQASSDSRPFTIAVSDRALFLLTLKRFALSDPYYLRRVPKQDTRRVAIERARPYGLWLLAAALLVVGAFTTVVMIQYTLTPGSELETWEGYPFAALVVGAVIPFVARTRLRLVVSTPGGVFEWTSPVVIGRAARQRVDDLFDAVAQALLAAEVRFVDARRGDARRA